MKKFNIIKVDHIAIAIKDSKKINKFFSDILTNNKIKNENVIDEKVHVSIFNAENINIEILEPTSLNSPIRKYLNKNKHGIHHISFLVDNIREAILYFESIDIKVIYNPPKVGASNQLITFLHPLDTFGVLIELSQDN